MLFTRAIGVITGINTIIVPFRNHLLTDHVEKDCINEVVSVIRAIRLIRANWGYCM